MRQVCWRLFAALVIAVMLLACTPQAPTVVPTKAPVAPVATVPQAPPSAPTAAPAATKPAAAPVTPTPAVKIKRGGTIVYSTDTDSSNFDPVMPMGGVDIDTSMGETLLRYHELDENTGKSEFRGQLAESWQQLDPLTIVFKLRKGVKFHDGSDFNAEVAKWVIERGKNHPKSVVKANAAFIKSVEVVDSSTLKINMAYPTALVFINFTAASGGNGSSWSVMLSKAAMDKYGEAYFENNFVGTGPFMLSQWLKGDRLVLKKFDGYWGKGADGNPLPYFDTLIRRIIADPAVALAEMRTGNVHATQFMEPFQYNLIKSSPELKLRIQRYAPIRFLFGFNQQTGPLANNLKLRQAAQYAIDRKSIADALGFGEFIPTGQVFWVPTFPGWDEKTPQYEYNPEKAKSLMAEAGYPNGVDVSLTTYSPPMWKQPAEIVQSQWNKVGLRTEIEAFDRTTAKNKLKAMEFQSTLFTMWPSPDPANYTRGLACDGAANWSSYCNKEVDKCLAEGEAEYDFNKRSEIYKRCQRMIYEDALIGATHWRPFTLTTRAELKGIRLQAISMDFFEAWLDK